MRGIGALLLVLLCLCAGCTPSSPPADGGVPADTLRLRVMDVGDADCILLTVGDSHILVDTGEEITAAQVTAQLDLWGVTQLDTLLITHHDKDHIGGAGYLLRHIPVSRIIQPDYDGDTALYAQYQSAAADAHIVPERLTAVRTLTVGVAQLTLYPADTATVEDDNNASILADVRVGKHAILLAGDAEKERLTEWMAQAPDTVYDVMKLPHHGRWNKASKAFLDRHGGAHFIACVSKDSGVKKKLANWMTQNERTLWCTYNGIVTVQTDGDTLTVTQS